MLYVLFRLVNLCTVMHCDCRVLVTDGNIHVGVHIHTNYYKVILKYVDLK